MRKAGEESVFVTTAVHKQSVFITHAEGLYRRLAYSTITASASLSLSLSNKSLKKQKQRNKRQV